MEEANSADIATVMEEFEESELLKIFAFYSLISYG